MPIPIFNSVASFFLKRRISQIELFKDYPIEVQQEVLRKLVVYSFDTEIGSFLKFWTWYPALRKDRFFVSLLPKENKTNE